MNEAPGQSKTGYREVDGAVNASKGQGGSAIPSGQPKTGYQADSLGSNDSKPHGDSAVLNTQGRTWIGSVNPDPSSIHVTKNGVNQDLDRDGD